MSPAQSSVAATLTAVTTAQVPYLVVGGVATGLRADVLLAGFCGAIVAMVLLNTVPRVGEDDWSGFLRSSMRRVGVAAASCLSAGYLTAGVGIDTSVGGPTLFFAFVIGAGAQTILPRAIEALKFVTTKGD